MVPVAAPRFDLVECSTESERIFIEALHARAAAGGWYADSWPRPDRVIVSVCAIWRGAVIRTLRVDFDGATVVFGDDQTHQFATDLNPALGAIVVTGKTPAELADLAADWLEQEMSGWPNLGLLLRAIPAVVFGVATLAAISFVCGIAMGLVDRLGEANKPTLQSYGLTAAQFGLLILGVPVSIVSGLLSWRGFWGPTFLLKRAHGERG